MSQIVLPQWVAQNERRRKVLEDQSSGLNQTRYWNRHLRDIDPRLSLVFVNWVEGTEVGVVPYRWHIVRAGDGAPDTYWAITTAGLGWEGEYREMADDVIETLRRGDLWDHRVRRDAETTNRRVEESKERGKQNTKEARVDDLATNIRALTSPGVSMSDTRWSYRKSGRRGRKG